jgi:hypothetical protein
MPFGTFGPSSARVGVAKRMQHKVHTETILLDLTDFNIVPISWNIQINITGDLKGVKSQGTSFFEKT